MARMLQRLQLRDTESKVLLDLFGPKALNVALLSMADVRADTLVRPISSRLVVVCESIAPDSFCGYWNTQEPCSAVGMLHSHDNGTPMKVSGDRHEWWLKSLYFSLYVQKLLYLHLYRTV